jgi:hypothetical protein
MVSFLSRYLKCVLIRAAGPGCRHFRTSFHAVTISWIGAGDKSPGQGLSKAKRRCISFTSAWQSG